MRWDGDTVVGIGCAQGEVVGSGYRPLGLIGCWLNGGRVRVGDISILGGDLDVVRRHAAGGSTFGTQHSTADAAFRQDRQARRPANGLQERGSPLPASCLPIQHPARHRSTVPLGFGLRASGMRTDDAPIVAAQQEFFGVPSIALKEAIIALTKRAFLSTHHPSFLLEQKYLRPSPFEEHGRPPIVEADPIALRSVLTLTVLIRHVRSDIRSCRRIHL
jgi:hypothetical protein